MEVPKTRVFYIEKIFQPLILKRIFHLTFYWINNHTWDI